jgi:outer membrane biosynthesis protein TonB
MARNTGKRPHEMTLDLFAKNATQTPSEIDAYVGNGPYASKHIWFLRKLGYDITVNKDGRSVINYIYNGPGTAVVVTSTTIEVAQKPQKTKAPKPAAEKTVKKAAAAKPKKPKAPEAEVPASDKNEEAPDGEPSRLAEIKAANLAMMQKVSARLAKRKTKKIIEIGSDEAEVVFGSSGEIATSFAVDNGWDSMDGINVRDFLR